MGYIFSVQQLWRCNMLFLLLLTLPCIFSEYKTLIQGYITPPTENMKSTIKGFKTWLVHFLNKIEDFLVIVFRLKLHFSF